jgi:CHAD domain-containing protein/adenylate cyclase class IV
VTGWVNEVARSKVPPVDATVEHERKLQAPDGFELPALGGSPLEPRVFTSVYYDVPSRSLTNAGITLRRRTERGKSVWQLKLPQADARLELEQPGGPTGPPDELRQLLLAHLRDRPVESIAELRTRRRGELVERGESTAEITVDEVAVMNGQSVSQAFVEVEIELRSGDPSRLDRIAREIARAGASPTNGTPKVFQALGIVPARAKRPTDPFEALRALLRIQLGEILRNDPGTRVGTDPESLHDMRVAVRRSRALLRAGRELVADDTQTLSAELQWLGEVLGAVRDLDVLLERLRTEGAALGGSDAKAAVRLLRGLSRERKRARDALLRALGDARYLELLDRFETTLDELAPAGADVTLDALARRELKKVRKAVEALPAEPRDEELHDLRKLGKRARYAAELARNRDVAQRSKELQDVLGVHQDSTVAEARLRALAATAQPADALAAGRLIEREHRRQADARAAWPRAWRKLDRASR